MQNYMYLVFNVFKQIWNWVVVVAQLVERLLLDQ